MYNHTSTSEPDKNISIFTQNSSFYLQQKVLQWCVFFLCKKKKKFSCNTYIIIELDDDDGGNDSIKKITKQKRTTEVSLSSK